MFAMLVIDDLTVLLLVVAVLLTLLITLRQETSDVPPARLLSQSEISRTRMQGETAVYRSRAAYNGLLTYVYNDAKTLYEAFQRGLRNFPNRPCLGQRINDGDFVWKTYAEVNSLATNFGSGLYALDIPHGQQSNIGIYSINRVEWCIADQACNAYSMVNVALYDTLGHEAVEFIIQQTDMKVVVASADKLATLLEVAPKCPKLKLIVSMDNDFPQDLIKSAEAIGVKLISFKDVCEVYGEKNLRDHIPPSTQDIATICYTSGTTGQPKGVMLTHQNLISNNAGIVSSWPAEILPTSEDVYLSYLPLAHMLERLIHTFVFANGARVGFFRGDVKKLLDDVALLRPTYFVSVPRLWNRIYDRVQAGVKESGFFKKTMFQIAYNAKLKLLRKGIIRNNTIWDKLVFNKIRARLGGRCKALVTGAAPISPEVIDMLRICFGCQVYEGYGQTESCAAMCVTVTGDYSSGHVGPPLACVDIKLVDVPEMNYFATDKPNPRGEVCGRGPSVCKGYYKEPEKTREAIDKDGWLHTGDIGEILPNGTLRIIDRKKNIFKLSQGEYVAAEKIENLLVKSSFIEQCWVYGSELQSNLIAVVVPDAEVIQPWAKQNNLPTDLPSLAKSPEVKKLLMAEIKKISKESKLHSFETPKDIIVESELFSVENDLLTPTFKLKRNIAKNKYKNQIEALYKKMADSSSASASSSSLAD